MTVDNENSIYVGGLPYDCSESQLRRAFELYGSILSVKIINARDVGGKCYGFVTFTNPRSAVEAINEMDGKTIGGRLVRVNEVKSRGGGGRSMHGRESFRHNQRDTDWDGGRGRIKEKGNIMDRQHDNSRELDGDRERWHRSRSPDQFRDNFQGRDRAQSRELPNREHLSSRSHDREPDRNYDLDATKDAQLDWDGGRGRVREKVNVRDRQHDDSRERDRERERWRRSRSRDHVNFQGRDRDQSRQNREHLSSRSHDRDADRDYDLDATKDTQLDRVFDHDKGGYNNKDHHSKRKHSSSYDRQSREHSSESSDYYNQEEQLDLLIKRRDELHKEKSEMEQSLEEKKQLIADLQKRSMKLEDSLTAAKKQSSMHQLQLTKLYNCYQQVKEYREKLKSSETELQDLVDSVSLEIDTGAVGAKAIHLRNGEV